MMNKISFSEVPYNYPLCIESDCPVAEHCLRQMAMQVLTRRERLVSIVNPKRTKHSEACDFYRSDEPQLFGKGFIGMQQEMLPRQYAVFMRKLQSRFGRNAYFERRRGERLCSPGEVAYIRELLTSLGLQHLDFDGYEERYDW